MKVINRIKNSNDFGETIKNGKTAKNSSFVIHYLNNNLNYTRVGISVSKKMGNAVTRNRVKRQIRAMIDSLINYDLNALDIIVIARQDFLGKSFDQNKNYLNELLREHAGIINEKEK